MDVVFGVVVWARGKLEIWFEDLSGVNTACDAASPLFLSTDKRFFASRQLMLVNLFFR
jgi:hypothetical protein